MSSIGVFVEFLLSKITAKAVTLLGFANHPLNLKPTINEGLGHVGQRFAQNQLTSATTNSGPPDTTRYSSVRPVLNYSIQTGEEFALEFMRERVTSKKSSGSNISADQISTTKYMDLRGMLGTSHTGSESGSDISVLAGGEKAQYRETEKKGFPDIDNKSQRYASSRSMPRVPSGEGSSRGGASRVYSSGTSDTSTKKMKILCSFGGKILPRPSDGKLRYVGGDTRIIRITKDISWQDLQQKTTSVYNQPHIVKYQLPGEDLDALVSVSCDEDLLNMMEECSVIEGGEGSQKLRMFLFSSDCEDVHFSLGSIEGDSEIQYVVAVNGMDVAGGKASCDHGLANTSASDMEQLVNLNIEADRATTISVPKETSVMPNTHNLVFPTSLALPQSLPNDYSTHVLSYQDSRMQYVGEHYLSSISQASDSFHNLNSRFSIPTSTPSDHNYNSQYAPTIGASTPNLTLELPNQVQVGSEGQHIDKTLVQNLPNSDTVLTVDVSANQQSASDHTISGENEHCVSLNQEAPHVSAIPEHVVSLFPLKYTERHLESVVVSSTADTALSSGLGTHIYEDDRYASGGVVTSECSDYETDIVDLTYHEPAPPASRCFHSERIPRQQIEILNRLSKSDDSIGSQFLNLNPRSDVTQESIAETVDSSVEGNMVSQTEKCSASKPPKPTTPTLEDGLVQFEKYKELADAIKKMNKNGLDEASNNLSHENLDQRNDLNRNAKINNENTEWNDLESGRKSEKYDGASEAGATKSTGKETPIDRLKVAAAVKNQLDNPTSVLPDISWEEISTGKVFTNNAVESVQVFPWGGSSSGIFSKGESSYSLAEQRDTTIEINDRFPQNLLADIFSNARIDEDSAAIGVLRKDDAAISLNMLNHEPQRWSFFRNLAQGEFGRKDVSLIDQDHIGYSPPLAKAENRDQLAYNFPLDDDGVVLSHMDSQVDFDEEIQQESSENIEDDANALHQDYMSAQISQPQLMDKVAESFQVENPYVKVGENLRTTAFDYEDLKFVIAETSGAPLDTEIDFGNLQNENSSPTETPMTSDIEDTDHRLIFDNLMAYMEQIIKNEDLEELRELGSGTFGTVYHGKWRGTDVAIKRIKKSCFTGRSSEQERLTLEFWREAEILSKLHHPNVVAFYGIVQNGPGGTLATVTEFMVNGSLRHVLLRKDK
ncbi:Serine/threonine-protein kinase EDR1 [Apostasia shenzhenica]|uniref:Serine/threonine-protein kinase EDR1 n=1 Tax=Apostasia shenzhenica TaxID=1088818 RepID=A0A2I0B059_9ASPA|nr:Serine/threonine-protein kinase EDR1 [Apostasia shenzhenica]